jgi:hypothetical protein
MAAAICEKCELAEPDFGIDFGMLRPEFVYPFLKCPKIIATIS